MLDTFLVPANTVVTSKGQGEAVPIDSANGRIFLAVLTVTNHVEQEALDVALFGSSDGVNWTAKPLLAFPQVFYRGTLPRLLDLRAEPQIRWLRAQWEITRWGRGAEAGSFELSVKLTEVESGVLREATS
jgi:hypothetical protein